MINKSYNITPFIGSFRPGNSPRTAFDAADTALLNSAQHQGCLDMTSISMLNAAQNQMKRIQKKNAKTDRLDGPDMASNVLNAAQNQMQQVEKKNANSRQSFDLGSNNLLNAALKQMQALRQQPPRDYGHH